MIVGVIFFLEITSIGYETNYTTCVIAAWVH